MEPEYKSSLIKRGFSIANTPKSHNLKFPKVTSCPSCRSTQLGPVVWYAADKKDRRFSCMRCGAHFGVAGYY